MLFIEKKREIMIWEIIFQCNRFACGEHQLTFSDFIAAMCGYKYTNILMVANKLCVLIV